VGDQFLKAPWAARQPGRGLFTLIVTFLFSFIIASSFSIEVFTGFLGYYVMSCIGLFIVIGALWGGGFISIEHVPQPFKGVVLLVFALSGGLLISYFLINFIGGGVLHPYLTIYTIVAVITMFFLFLAFGFWPFNKLSLPAAGFLFIIFGYLIALCLTQLFNFNLLSYPAGVSPSPIAAVPFYQAGGPLFGLPAPSGPIPWEHAAAYTVCSVDFLWMFAALGMWPFTKLKMKQPLFGVVVSASCLILGYILLAIGIHLLKIEPLTFMSYAVSFIFGVLLLLTLFQLWPGNTIKSAAGGFLNIVLAIVIAIVGNYGIRAFCLWKFGDAMVYPDDLFATNTMMLALLFPMWAAYGDLFQFWPLPPLAPPDGEPSP
jgi:hypothetical protein